MRTLESADVPPLLFLRDCFGSGSGFREALLWCLHDVPLILFLDASVASSLAGSRTQLVFQFPAYSSARSDGLDRRERGELTILTVCERCSVMR